MKLLRHDVFERFDRDLRRYMRSAENVCEEFWGTTERLFNDALNIFSSLASQILFEEAEAWVE